MNKIYIDYFALSPKIKTLSLFIDCTLLFIAVMVVLFALNFNKSKRV